MDEKQTAQQVNREKQAKQAAGNTGADQEVARKKKRISGKAVAAILIVILVAGAFACYYFNLFGVKTKVIDFFKAQDPTYQTTIDEYNKKKNEYEQKQGELSAKEESLKQREQQLNEKEAEQGTTATTGGSASKSIAAAAPVFEQMDKNAAAEIFNNTASDAWIAGILSAIDEKKAADILGAMDPARASSVSQYMS